MRSMIGQFDEAREGFLQAIAIAKDVGNRLGEAVALGRLASIRDDDSDSQRVELDFEDALRIAEEVGSPRTKIRLHFLYGDWLLDRGHVDRAAHHFRAAAPMPDRKGHLQNGPALGALGFLCAQRGQFTEAETHFKSGAPLAQAESKHAFGLFCAYQAKAYFLDPNQPHEAPVEALDRVIAELGCTPGLAGSKTLIYPRLRPRHG